MSNKNYTTHLNQYNEPDALQQLLVAMHDALVKQNERFESDDWLGDEFTITVNGIQTAFYLGGPQADAIYAFVQHIASENGYEVDIDKNTVVE